MVELETEEASRRVCGHNSRLIRFLGPLCYLQVASGGRNYVRQKEVEGMKQSVHRNFKQTKGVEFGLV